MKNKKEEIVEETVDDVVEEKPKKRKHIKTIRGKALTAYIVVIIVIALALSYGCGFLLGKELYDKKEKNEDTVAPTEEQQKDNQDEPKEENDPIENNPVEKPVETPKQDLETAKKKMNETYNKLYNENNFGIFGLELTQDNKLSLLLDSLEFTNNKLSEEVVKNEYKKMYGDTLTSNPKELNGINTCSLYKYNSSTKEYTSTTQGCDMGWGWHLYSYVYKHEVDGNNAYLYTSIAVEDGFGDTTNPAKIYTDFDEPYEEKYLFTTISTGARSFVLDQSNYANFAKYKFTFSFDNNEYHFKKIEKIENGKTK